MLLGALMSNEYAPGAVSRPVLDRLAGLTLARGFGNNPTYCHGDLACAEIVGLGQELVPGLFGAAARTGAADDGGSDGTGDGLDDLYPRLFDEVVERYGQRSDTKYAYTNSLMVGEAGLAWSVLRHLDPGSHPSLLRFA
ncbi:hypothetical protein GA0115255_103262 [Streptomyces sp. Ncost-T6T-2b]|nr:hypothetical protein GA0115255_103262 [Streptomyces sp. Ncost-T6T-2b]